MSFSWRGVLAPAEAAIATIVKDGSDRLDDGQRASLLWLAQRIEHSGLVLADEVGTGKTRIACALIKAVLDAGGRAAVIAPHGLIHQWRSESLKFDAEFPPPKSIATLTDYFRAGNQETNRPCPDRAEWWIVSHGFRAPHVGERSDAWRVALPALTETYLASKQERGDGRTRYGRLLAAKEDYTNRLEWAGIDQIAKEVADRIRGLRTLRNRLKRLPWLDLAIDGPQAFGDEHRHIVQELLGHWLGCFDLVIIDEAHKGRSPDDANRTLLSILLGSIIQQRSTTRRLCVTATPMELDLHQWIDVLKRAQATFEEGTAEAIIKEFTEARAEAMVAPDEDHRLARLCRAARSFETTLRPFVTRRLRGKDELLSRFGAALGKTRSHPHRRVERIDIQVDRESAWASQVFYAECLRESVKGLSNRPMGFSRAGAWLANGYVSEDLEQWEFGALDPDSPVRDARKTSRARYWLEHLQRPEAAGSDNTDLSSATERLITHPRIVAAVREIEAWTCQGEKVLVFGVFLQPLRLLRDILNVRSALRLVRDRRPIPQAIHSQPRLLQLAAGQTDLLPGGVPEDRTLATLKRELSNAHRAYEQMRRRMLDQTKKAIQSWRQKDEVLGPLTPDPALDRALRDHLLAFVLERQLREGNQFTSRTPGFAELAQEFAWRHIRPLLSAERYGPGGQNHPDVAHDALCEVFIDDSGGPMSHHARVMEGSTGWQTRRHAQAAFNNPDASPQVLIAQSLVGREGLNLHEACRVVVQFHAEWNPAVLEQQVGRVDRKGSKWEHLAEKWLKSDRTEQPPFIEIRQLVFDGTYDAFQWQRVTGRQHSFNASLFGALLPPDAWEKVPTDLIDDVREAAPTFSPAQP